MEEKRKRIILIGRSTAGKTTLCQRINHEDLAYHKTQTVQIVNQTMIDTPGEYLERRYFRGALMVTATDADFIVLVQDATENGCGYEERPCHTETGGDGEEIFADGGRKQNICHQQRQRRRSR